MKTVEVLIAARALITHESRYLDAGVWMPGRVKGFVYMDSEHNETLKLSEATCFCSLGAINAAVGADAESYSAGLSGGGHGEEFYARYGTTKPTKHQRRVYLTATKYLTAALVKVTGNRFVNIVGTNDAPDTHETILAAFDLAIKDARRRHISKAPGGA